MEDPRYSKIGKVYNGFGTFQLKSVLIKNDAGDWGTEPNENAVGIIRSTNFNNNGKLDLSDIAYRTLSPQKFEDKKLSFSDILIERSGGSATQPVGRIGYITDDMTDKKLSFANFIQRISLDETVDAKFVYYCLQQMYEMGITASMQFQTTGIRNLDWKFYLKTYLPKPTKEEQTAIANILSMVDEAIASVLNSIAAAERLKKSLMQNLLTGKMKPDGTFRTPEEFYIDDKFGKVPVGWHWGRLAEIADIIAGQSPQGEYYNVNGMGKPMLNGPTEFTDKYPVPVQWTTKITKLCKKGDILFTVRGSSTGRMNLADQEYCIGRGLAAIRPKSNNNISFIYYTLLKISEMILAEAKGAGTTFPNVSRGELMKKVILIPDTHQNEIIAPIEQLASFSNSKQRSIDKLEILKKSLMQNLLTGKVEISKK